MTTHTHKLSLDEVLDEFFYSSDTPDTLNLKKAINAYPEYRQDIVEFAALWASYENSPSSTEEVQPSSVPNESVSRLQSFVLNRLHELDHEPKRDNAAQLSAAKEGLNKLAGNALRRAAKAAGLYGSSALLQKVLNNGISNVPRAVVAQLAAHLQVSVVTLSIAIRERGLGGARSYKASDKPTVGTSETWENAVKGMPMTDEQKKALLALCDDPS